jgi:hypothetical protein
VAPGRVIFLNTPVVKPAHMLWAAGGKRSIVCRAA